MAADIAGFRIVLRLLVPIVALIVGTGLALAQPAPFAGGWTLEPTMSTLRLQSVKNETKVESSEFRTFTGQITEDGTASLQIALESLDTGIDLRNVRMRFLFFETFQYPTATVTTRLDPAQLADLAIVRRKIVPLDFTLDLHGVTRQWQADVAVTLLTDDQVVVSTGTPVSIPVSGHALEDGLRKLEEAASVVIVPSATVSFDLVFRRNSVAPDAPAVATAAASAAPVPSAAVEPAGAFDREACIGRFEILSRTDNITFRSGRSTLEPDSHFLLDSIVDIVGRCPGLKIEVGGHTDNVGSDAANLALSDRRAASVVTYLVGKGVDRARITSVGYGEARPIADNATADNRRRNRRIEFRVINGQG